MMPGKTRKQQLQEMLAEEPNDRFLRYGLAMEFVSEGNDDEAVRCFHELLGIAPDYVPGYVQAAQALVRLGRPEEARVVFGRGIAIARKQGDHHAADEMEGFLASLE
jgi:Tfp pilus assembly protein PilF